MKAAETKELGTNPNARRNYFIEDTMEAGIVLHGTEIKSLRTQAPNLKDAHVDVTPQFEAWLLNLHIAPYSHGNIHNHDPMRKRKLLLHRHEIEQLFGAIHRKGLAVVATRIYLVKGRAKVEIGIAKGKKAHDKREDLKQKSAKKEMAQAIKRGRRGDE